LTYISFYAIVSFMYSLVSGPGAEQLADEAFALVETIKHPSGFLDQMVELARAGHPAALDKVKALAHEPSLEGFYDGRLPSFYDSADMKWSRQWSMAGIAGALATHRGFEEGAAIAALIEDNRPRGAAFINIGEAGFPQAFSTGLSYLKHSPRPPFEDVKRVADYLVEHGDRDTLAAMHKDLTAGSAGLKKEDYKIRMIRAAINAETDIAEIDALFDEIAEEGWAGFMAATSELQGLAETGDEYGIEKLLQVSVARMLTEDSTHAIRHINAVTRLALDQTRKDAS
jgi:hypothetical protein